MATKSLASDDSKTLRLAVKITFAAEDADVTSVSKGSDAVARAKQLSPDVILVDTAHGALDPPDYALVPSLNSDPPTNAPPVRHILSNHTPVAQAPFPPVDPHGLTTNTAKPQTTNAQLSSPRAAGHILVPLP